MTHEEEHTDRVTRLDIEAAEEAARDARSRAVTVANPAEAKAQAAGQWVQDANGVAYCLIDTHMGWPQRMAMKGRSLTSVDSLAYPLHLCDPTGGCEHEWGTHEMGQCFRCGQVVAEPRPVWIGAGVSASISALLNGLTPTPAGSES